MVGEVILTQEQNATRFEQRIRNGRRQPRRIMIFQQPSLQILLTTTLILLLSFRSEFYSSYGFVIVNRGLPSTTSSSLTANQQKQKKTSLAAWTIFGDDTTSPGVTTTKQDYDNDESFVDVKIERPTMNSRRIIGDIRIPSGVTVDDVWSILTDYDRLSIHVPNLKESRIVKQNNNSNNNARGTKNTKRRPGDGSYQCRLYQVGAQKIIGFDFSASVTMDMTEQIEQNQNTRKIHFKCVDSQFFSVFDGSWTVTTDNNANNEVKCSYDVLVKPNGPVPVAALEWRIREDVPTNLRAVKKAATALSLRAASSSATTTIETATMTTTETTETTLDDSSSSPSSSSSARNTNNVVTAATRMVSRRVKNQIKQAAMKKIADWDRGETMSKYLD